MSKFKSSGRLATALRKPPARPAPPPKNQAPAAVPAAQPEIVVDEAFEARVSNPTRQLALKCTLLFLFFRFSFLHEFISSKLHFDTHILLVVAGLSCFTAFLAGGIFEPFQERATWMWFAFASCMTVATVFSTWRGGSFGQLMPYLRTTLPLVLLVPAVAYTPDDIRKVVNTIGLAGVATTLIGFLSSDFKTGRMALGSAGSDIQDSNDYAAHMILVLPAMAYFFFQPKRNPFYKIFGTLILAAGLYQVFSTGSRGGLVGLICTALYILKRGSPKVRLAILAGVPTLAIIAFTLIPQESAGRLKALFGVTEGAGDAIESREARQALFWASVHITLHHPLLGVGPGEFMDYQFGLAHEKGQLGMWHETHNAYTQISSECGIPALIFYIVAAGMTYMSLLRMTKSGTPVLSTIANVLSIMLFGYSVCIIFLSHGYNFAVPVITAITTSLNRHLPKNNAEHKAAFQANPAARLSA